jgi:hypothetical protein
LPSHIAGARVRIATQGGARPYYHVDVATKSGKAQTRGEIHPQQTRGGVGGGADHEGVNFSFARERTKIDYLLQFLPQSSQ